jgi:hypothetical protein
LEFILQCIVYSLIIVVATIAVVVVFTREALEILLILNYALLAEGGLAMVVGGAVASFSPAIGKIGEVVFRSEPWDAKRLREAEGTARVWIVTGIFLFLFWLLVSALSL